MYFVEFREQSWSYLMVRRCFERTFLLQEAMDILVEFFCYYLNGIKIL